MRVLSPRLLTVAAAAGTAAVAAATTVLGIVDVLGLVDALQLSATVVAFGLLVVALVGIRRVDGKVQRLIRNHREQAERVTAPAADPELRTRIDDVLASLGEDRVM